MKLNVTWRVPFLDISTNESTLLISVQHSILMLRLGFSLISHYPLTQRITACHSGQASPHHTRTPYNIRGQILSWRTPESTPIWQLNKQLNDYYISIVWHLTSDMAEYPGVTYDRILMASSSYQSRCQSPGAVCSPLRARLRAWPGWSGPGSRLDNIQSQWVTVLS